ncbi:MAG: flagellar basal-body rod protein FlgG [Spongiibacteraceae bacterium]|jgi:flagellar basal-body rod protein FlgG|nr:flagellar basal-body rod protein FlgG [Spongiibacteraceae bacterium]
MMSALWVSKTGLSAQDRRMTTIANNLANAATVGFKRDDVMFEDLLYQTRRQPGAASSQITQLPSGMQLGTGVRVAGTSKQFTEGSLQITERSLDIAVNGRGFFEVQMPDGTIAYTRNGQFHINSDGELVTTNGLLVQPGVAIPQDAQTITISEDGIVEVTIHGEAEPQQIGQIQLTDFINPSGLQAIGSNLFLETAASGAPQQGQPGNNGLGRVQQGALENSNVDVVEELVNMITTQRTYEMNSKVISTTDQMLQFITQTL